MLTSTLHLEIYFCELFDLESLVPEPRAITVCYF